MSTTSNDSTTPSPEENPPALRTYDMLTIVEVPDDETLGRHLLWLGSQGNVRTKTVKAFTEDEYRKIVGGIK